MHNNEIIMSTRGGQRLADDAARDRSREVRRRMRGVRAEMSRALRGGVENVFDFGYFKNSFSSLAAIGCLMHSVMWWGE